MSLSERDLRVLSPGEELLGYRVERVIGRGGMGVVYLAEQLVLDRLVALKLLAPELAADEVFRERFLRESRLAASLDHPNIVPVFDAGEVEGRLYIAMRYVEGRDLGQLLEEEAPLAPERAIALLAPIADALDTAHAKGLVHRDVKPSNILLDQAERPYLADFGLTKEASERGLVEQSHFAASVSYVAPEQIEGKPVDGKADQYALACVLFECLTGQTPYANASPMATLWGQLDEPPPRASERNPVLPTEIDTVLARALAKDQEDRHPSCVALVDAAARVLSARSAAVARDRRSLVAAVAAVAAIAVALVAFLLVQTGSGPVEPSTEPTLTPEVDSLQRIDVATNELVATIGLGPSPGAVAVGEGAVWVIDRAQGTVSRIDPETNAMVKTAAVGTAPSSLAVGDGIVWVSSAGNFTLTELSAAQMTIVPILPGGSEVDACGQVAAGEGAGWVLGGSHLFRISPTGIVRKFYTRASCVGDIAVGKGAVWLASYSDVVRIDSRTLKAESTIRLPFVPADVAADSEGVWVVDRRGSEVVEIDPRTNRVAGRVVVRGNPVAVALGEGSVWTANNDGTISRIDPKALAVVARIKVGPSPIALAAGEDGVWVLVPRA